jgi:hypothetical protein
MDEPISKTPASAHPSNADAPSPAVKLVAETVNKAELLLGHAAEAGIEIDDETRDAILTARTASDAGNVTEQTTARLLKAFTRLAARVRPVTVDSLIACRHPKQARQTIRLYSLIAVLVGCIIVFISLITIVSDSISAKIRADIELANGLAAKLRAELGPSPTTPATANPAPDAGKTGTLSQDEVWFGPAGSRGLSAKDVISDLQEFAATEREIDAYSRQLLYFLGNLKPAVYSQSGTNMDVHKRRRLELTPGLDVLLAQELTDKVEEYQIVRNIANNVQDRVTVYYGAMASCFLPVLYALLGAGAYLLRSYEDQIKSRTLSGSDRHISRFLIAGICGLVVGLFNVAQGASISPFAVAFLVGYAVDVFFAFLEGLLQMFKRTPDPACGCGTSHKQ